MKNLKTNIYNLLVEASVAEEQAKKIGEKNIQKS